MANRSRNARRRHRSRRVRAKVTGTRQRPRLNVFRSLTQIYAQVIDDEAGNTLAAASTVEAGLKEALKGLSKTDQATRVGELIAERAKAAGVSSVVFDRAGYRFHGRVKALAEGARKGGLSF